MLDLVHDYCNEVLAGEVVAGYLERRAVERFVHDLEHAHERGWRFDKDRAQRAIDFCTEELKHSKGRWAGEPFILSPWQAFIHANVFGWVSAETGLRRFRSVYEDVARKNGKTTKLAGVGIFGMYADGERGAEIYSAATKKDQAKRTFVEAVSMRDQSPNLSADIKRSGSRIEPRKLYDIETGSFFVPLGRDSDTEDGLNVHMALIDEYHAHKGSEMFDVLDTATGARTQPLIWVITTAGFDQTSPCYDYRDYSCRVLDGFDKPEGAKADTHFAIIFTLDGYETRDGQPDDPYDPAMWRKPNPNLGVTVSVENLQEKADKAREIPRYKNNYLTKHMNIWTNSAVAWANMDDYRACDAYQVPMRGRECYGGLDLASTTDTCALVLSSENERGGSDVWAHFWIPEAAIQTVSAKGSQLYAQWVEQGYMTVTPGEIIDYEFIETDIKRICLEAWVREIAFDRWNSSMLVQRLTNSGVPMIGFGQGFASMNAPMVETERQIAAKLLNHQNNPVLDWQMSCLQARQDPAGNIKPDRKESKKSIDGPVALFMAEGARLASRSDVFDGELMVVG